MKCNEIIGKPLLALSEGRLNSYDELLDKEKLDTRKPKSTSGSNKNGQG